MSKKILITMALLTTILSACGSGAETASVPSDSAPQVSAPAETLPAQETPAANAPAPAAQPAASVSYANDVAPIFAASCNNCHGVDQVKAGLDMTSYDKLMQGSFEGAVIVPGDAEASLLVDLVVRGKMPKRGDKLTDGQIQLIRDWINAGAPNN